MPSQKNLFRLLITFLVPVFLIFSCKKKEDLPEHIGITGKVTDHATGSPLDSAFVAINDGWSGGIVISFKTKSDGTYALYFSASSVKDKAFAAISFSRPEFKYHSQSIDFTTGNQVINVALDSL